MATLTVEDEQTNGRRRSSSRQAVATTAQDPQEREWLVALREEIDGYFTVLSGYPHSDPADVMASISSIHARLAHIRILLHRNGSQRATAVRTREVDPLIEALEFQFKCHSRMISLAEQEWKIAGGAS